MSVSSYTCICKQTFTAQNYLSTHKHSCSHTKKRLSSAITSFKEFVAPLPTQSTSCGEGIVTPDLEGGDIDEGEEVSLAQQRTRRQNCQLPLRFRDVLPQPLPTAPMEVRDQPPESVGSVVTTDQRPALPTRKVFCTPPNIFGLVRQYFSSEPPSHDPEEYITLADLSFIPGSLPVTEEPPMFAVSSSDSQYHPYPNRLSFQLGNWYWNQGIQKSQGDYAKLLEILSDDTFNTADRINRQLGANKYDEGDEDEWEDEDAGWKKTPVSIKVPFSHTTDTPGPQSYQAAELYHHSLVAVMREKLANAQDDKLFHYEPYELHWKTPHLDREIPIYGDLYTSPAFLDAHSQLQESPRERGCDLPQVVAGLMFWSDATQLTSFGNAKLWPTYMYFGNESKYHRCKPSCNLSNHVAYFEMLPDLFKDFAGSTSEGATHCCRELFQEQWNILLDKEFLEAYAHRIVIHCCDGITCRFYPRIFMYSADYPEKVLIATIRNLGGCPCPCCLIPKDWIQNMGSTWDRQQHKTLEHNPQKRGTLVSAAHKLIYEKNYSVSSMLVESILKPESWVPTSNSFIDRLSPMGFNIFCALVVDLLHKFEISVWKMLFIHLLHIISAQDKDLIHQLDKRYKQTPTFGAATIRKFSANSSDMSCMVARNFEDLLQLLFTMAHWHGLAKLRMHSDLTLEIMDEVTSTLGQQFREFKTTVCAVYQTCKLHKEVEAHAQCHAKKAGKQTAGCKGKESCNLEKQAQSTQNFHALGDYVSTICWYGTSDLYSTELGELEHCSPKARYCHTDHKLFVKQLTQIEHQQARICHIRDRIVHRPHVEISELATSPEAHHRIGLTQNHQGDPAIIDDRMFRHNIARFNYTTYNVCRAQDVINPRTSHCNVMVLRSDTNIEDQGHRYMYGKVLGIYHVNVIYIRNGMINYTPSQMEFLWIHWYEPINQYVLRGCHVIPHFSSRRKHVDGLGMSANTGDKDD
ncbi:hypothetical protein BDR06DRAFT_983179 [Suillus hirtellus]|nr:hypothetical protein BDR06DRAFT_983179 [Suillus hirtellus]